MRKLYLLLAFLLCIPSLAQDDPLLTLNGLEDYHLGERPPQHSRFPGLTTLTQKKTEWVEGEEYHNTYLKFFQNGHYLGKATLEKGVIEEIVIVDPRARYEGGFAVGQRWDEVQRVFPQVRLAYTYIMGVVVASSPQVPGLQAHFEQTEYKPIERLPAAEWLELKEDDIPQDARVKALRLYRTE